MDGRETNFTSSALQVNLERTAARVEIPERYGDLLRAVEGHYGISERTRELLIELNHPFKNWDYVLTQLKTLAIGDFYDLNAHPDGRAALAAILDIHFEVMFADAAQETKEKAVRFLFDFLNTVISKSGMQLPGNMPLFSRTIDRLLELSLKDDGIVRKISSYIREMASFLLRAEAAAPFRLGLLLGRAFTAAYKFWLSQPDPAQWFGADGSTEGMAAAYLELIRPISHTNLAALLDRVGAIGAGQDPSGEASIASYLEMPDYFQIVNAYLLVADGLERSKTYAGREHLVKLDFLMNVINTAGLSDIHGTALIEINRCLSLVFREETPENLDGFIRKTFFLLKRYASGHSFQNTLIACITTIAREVFKQNNHPLVDAFVDELIGFGFEQPDVLGATAEWQMRVNPAHIENIRSWLAIIAMKPRWTKRFLSALIINLRIGGVFVRDTDLLQRDVSNLLNADIEPAYNLVRQLLVILPIYFNEIGAEGELREISTKIDELCFRNDPLIHFVRKQSHVDSNSRLVPFMEDIFSYWRSGSRAYIEPHLPCEVVEAIVPAGEYFDGMHRLFEAFLQKADMRPQAFLEWDRSRIAREINAVKGVPERDRERGTLALRLYQLLCKKYNPQHVDLIKDLEKAYLFNPAQLRSLEGSLKSKNYRRALEIVLDFLTVLKQKILSPGKSTYSENIYYKRHIAAGIPSMYGTYREEKFEAVGLSLRLESLAAVLFERLKESLNLKFITRGALTRIHQCLWLYIKALDLEGLATEGLVVKVKYITSALKVKQFSVDQYLDIFRFISKGVQDIIKDYYIDTHGPNLPLIIDRIRAGPLPRTDWVRPLTKRRSISFRRTSRGPLFPPLSAFR